MAADCVCKIVCQYNQAPLSREDMDKPQEIAWDYSKVKDYVYQRYGGVRSLSKIYPGYTVQNEMTRSGLRESLEICRRYIFIWRCSMHWLILKASGQGQNPEYSKMWAETRSCRRKRNIICGIF